MMNLRNVAVVFVTACGSSLMPMGSHFFHYDFPDFGMRPFRDMFLVPDESAPHLYANVRFIAILYWRADFELDLQGYSVLASELLDTSLHSSAIRDTGFSEEI
jgi:hypothetical protein